MNDKGGSIVVFRRAIDERHKAVLGRLSELLSALVSEDVKSKADAAHALRKAADSLTALLAERDQPVWLRQVRDATAGYERKHQITGAANNLVQSLVTLIPQAQGYDWSAILEDHANPINFEAIYAEAYRESKLDELFAQLLDQLEKIHREGGIDSRTAIGALERLIATIKRNRRSSILATVGMVTVARTYIRNVLRRYLDDNAVTGPLIRAADDTVDQLDLEVGTLQKAISVRVTRELSVGDVAIEYRDNTDLPRLPPPNKH